jgi:hypothetical protein
VAGKAVLRGAADAAAGGTGGTGMDLMRALPEKTPLSFLSFLYVCPEPVLVK